MITNFIKFVNKTDSPEVLNNVIKRLYSTDLEEALTVFDERMNTAIMYSAGEATEHVNIELTDFHKDVRSSMLTILLTKLATLPDSEMN